MLSYYDHVTEYTRLWLSTDDVTSVWENKILITLLRQVFPKNGTSQLVIQAEQLLNFCS